MSEDDVCMNDWKTKKDYKKLEKVQRKEEWEERWVDAEDKKKNKFPATQTSVGVWLLDTTKTLSDADPFNNTVCW